ncbi:TIGR02996 domain-containing protein [Fimbriiglobus ruber]|uniref:TIGR02996 domain-containing protein n=1 Tax=Fimbriiglobus ruber TaxID=1908690 RepID=UPI000B4B85C9
MSNEESLLAAIWEHPHDDLPRLVYADWLEEAGEPVRVARAEFIRVQCELAKMPADDPGATDLYGGNATCGTVTAKRSGAGYPITSAAAHSVAASSPHHIGDSPHTSYLRITLASWIRLHCGNCSSDPRMGSTHSLLTLYSNESAGSNSTGITRVSRP